jgi:hypothetical protein
VLEFSRGETEPIKARRTRRHGNDRFLMTGSVGDLFWSVDGARWTAGPALTPLRAVAHGGAGFVAVGTGGAIIIVTDRFQAGR